MQVWAYAYGENQNSNKKHNADITNVTKKDFHKVIKPVTTFKSQNNLGKCNIMGNCLHISLWLFKDIVKVTLWVQMGMM